MTHNYPFAATIEAKKKPTSPGERFSFFLSDFFLVGFLPHEQRAR